MIENTTHSARSLRSVHPVATERADRAAISIEVSTAEGMILVKLSGTPRPESVIKLLDDVDKLASNDSSLRVLIDETDLDPSFVGPSDKGRFVGAWRRAAALKSTRIAVFVSNLAVYGLNRMFQGLAESGGHLNVCGDRASAVAWLSTVPR
jgi:hypothetical protein